MPIHEIINAVQFIQGRSGLSMSDLFTAYTYRKLCKIISQIKKGNKMINKKCDIGDAEIEFEHGKLAIQAPGSVVVSSGETIVLVTAVSNQEVREGIDFFLSLIHI